MIFLKPIKKNSTISHCQLKIISGYSFGTEAGRIVLGLCKTIARKQRRLSALSLYTGKYLKKYCNSGIN
jgi:hypothetical protein